jgi:hypothetical protein
MITIQTILNKKFCGGPGGGFSKEPLAAGGKRKECVYFDLIALIDSFKIGQIRLN